MSVGAGNEGREKGDPRVVTTRGSALIELSLFTVQAAQKPSALSLASRNLFTDG